MTAPVSLPTSLRRETGADGETHGRPADDAVSELFERHAAAAWGVAYAVVRNQEDARDAVSEAFAKLLGRGAALAPRASRAYFLRVVHNAAVDIQRRSRRAEPGVAGLEDRPGPDRDAPGDAVLAEEDRAMVASAFAAVPDRWREALWLIDVEGLSTPEAGAVLGVSAANVAQLATRGRRRLREQYLQAHVPNHARPACVATVEILGRYAAGALAARRRAGVERHVADCAPCAARLAELDDLGVKLRRALPPLPLGLPWRGEGRVQAVWDLFGARVGPFVAHASAGGSPLVERLTAGAAAAVLAVGLSTWAMQGAPNPPAGNAGGAAPVAAPVAGAATPAVGRSPAPGAESAAVGGSPRPALITALTPGYPLFGGLTTPPADAGAPVDRFPAGPAHDVAAPSPLTGVPSLSGLSGLAGLPQASVPRPAASPLGVLLPFLDLSGLGSSQGEQPSATPASRSPAPTPAGRALRGAVPATLQALPAAVLPAAGLPARPVAAVAGLPAAVLPAAGVPARPVAAVAGLPAAALPAQPLAAGLPAQPLAAGLPARPVAAVAGLPAAGLPAAGLPAPAGSPLPPGPLAALPAPGPPPSSVASAAPGGLTTKSPGVPARPVAAVAGVADPLLHEPIAPREASP